MPSLPWRGRFIAVDEHGEVEWRRCANCSRELTDPESRRRGIGPDCERGHDADQLEAQRVAALEEDRERWRLGLSEWDAKPAEVRRRLEARKRRERIGDPSDKRWATLQAALAQRERAIRREP